MAKKKEPKVSLLRGKAIALAEKLEREDSEDVTIIAAGEQPFLAVCIRVTDFIIQHQNELPISIKEKILEFIPKP